MKKTNLDVVKEYIANNGVSKFIDIDFLDSFGITDTIREGLEDFDDFQNLFDCVLRDGMTQKDAEIFIANVGEYLSQEDKDYVKIMMLI